MATLQPTSLLCSPFSEVPTHVNETEVSKLAHFFDNSNFNQNKNTGRVYHAHYHTHPERCGPSSAARMMIRKGLCLAGERVMKARPFDQQACMHMCVCSSGGSGDVYRPFWHAHHQKIIDFCFDDPSRLVQKSSQLGLQNRTAAACLTHVPRICSAYDGSRPF